jgi:hypothetical protein
VSITLRFQALLDASTSNSYRHGTAVRWCMIQSIVVIIIIIIIIII